MAELSRQRIYVLMEREQIRTHRIKGTPLVCLSSLMEFQEITPRAKKTLDKKRKGAKSLSRNGL